MIVHVLMALQLILGHYSPRIVNKPFPAFNIRDSSDNILVIHYDSGQGLTSTLHYLRRKGNAYNYVIGQDGTIIKTIDPKYEARHAGISYYSGHFRLNHYSIGVCLIGDGVHLYTQEQYESLVWLVLQLRKRYKDLKDGNIVGHSDIAIPRGRKKDPGKAFDWIYFFTMLHENT